MRVELWHSCPTDKKGIGPALEMQWPNPRVRHYAKHVIETVIKKTSK